MLRGQLVKSTVRGRTLPSEEFRASLSREQAEEERSRAAKEKQERLERALKLEQYQQAKFSEQMKALEALKASREAYEEERRRREEKRQARGEELKKQLETDMQRKIQAEKVQEDREKEQRQKEAEERARWKRYHERQKNKLNEWPGRDETDAKEAKQREGSKEKRSKKSLQETYAEARIRRLPQGTEERPPMPPVKQHDKPRSVLVDAGMLSSSDELKSPRQPVISWTLGAKAVSGMYGLSEQECSNIEGHFTRGIRGAGRQTDSVAARAKPRPAAVAAV